MSFIFSIFLGISAVFCFRFFQVRSSADVDARPVKADNQAKALSKVIRCEKSGGVKVELHVWLHDNEGEYYDY